MGYRIDYQPVKKLRNTEKRHSSVLGLTGMFFLIFLLMTKIFWPEGTEILRELMIPGDNAVTASAFSVLFSDLKSQTSLHDALVTFCRSIVFP